MPTEDQATRQPPTGEQQPPKNEQKDPDEESSPSDSDYDSDSDSDLDSHSEDYEPESESDSEDGDYKKKKKKKKKDKKGSPDTRPGDFGDIPEEDNSPEANLKLFERVLKSRRYQKMKEDKLRRRRTREQRYDFPKDWEYWKEEDLRELWADGPCVMTEPGWDPAFADEHDWRIMAEEAEAGRDPPIAPFYLPFRRFYPVIPSNITYLNTPRAVVEELDMIEEFLRWVSYVFPDCSSYEGTVWDDVAHGKGVYVAERGLVRYEGEWFRNAMEGHGVVEVDIPDIEPIPGSKLEAEMRAEGNIIKRDFMSPEDKEWMEMDVEDTVRLADGIYEIPWYEKDAWLRHYEKKPEVGRYRYAGQWKHSRMHGCGVYEVNERTIYGRFYFGELVNDPAGCDEEACALHAGIAEVAAAKARMFINKPDGMVREERGPYGDPQHPYFYEEEDAWQAPGFINEFYEVPDYWKTYVNEVDQEREMWLNSFYKAPLRLPMPAELEYWWERDISPEFILLNKEREPDPNDPSKLVYTEDPVILHTPTGRIINFIEDEEHGVRMFWQPLLKEGEDVDPEQLEFLPLGFDEFYGRETMVKKNIFNRLMSSVENTLKAWFEKLEKWAEDQQKAYEMKKQLLQQQMELVDDEMDLEEAIEEMEQELKKQEKEVEKSVEMSSQEDVSTSPLPNKKEELVSPQEENVEEEEEEEEEEEDDSAPSSFGSVADPGSTKNKGNGSGRSPFSTLSFASSGLLSMVPSMVERSFLSWKIGKSSLKPEVHTPFDKATDRGASSDLVAFPRGYPEKKSLKVKFHADQKFVVKHRSRKVTTSSQISSVSSQSMYCYNYQDGPQNQRFKWPHGAPETSSECILSLQMPVECSNLCFG